MEQQMKLHDLVKPLDEQTDEELIERLRSIRHNRFIERPAVKKRKSDEEVKTKARSARSTGSKLDKVLSSLTDEQRAALIAKLSGDGNDQDEGSTSGQDSSGGPVQD